MADDAGGRLLREALESEGVTLAVLPAPRSSTVVALLAADGERTMLSDRRSLEIGGLAAALAGATWVHCSGYALLDDASGDVLAAALGGRPEAARLSLGGGSVPRESARAGRFRERLQAAQPDLLLLSRDEASALLPEPPRNAEAAAKGLADLAAVVVVTAGAAGSAASASGEPITVPGVELADPVLDATGAGDAFAAALLYELAAQPWPPDAAVLREAMQSGGRLGALAARVVGAQGHVPGETELAG
jgi:sugar/nucleoside kinase (ribokinase family)